MERTVWEIEISHEGLNKYRHIRGANKDVVEQKAAAQLKTWEEMWEKKQATEKKRQAREEAVHEKEEKKQLAIEKTAEAQEALKNIENTLKHALDINNKIDWESLIDNLKYPIERPTPPNNPPDPPHPKIGLLELLIPSIKRKRIKEWEAEKQKALDKTKESEIAHEKAVKKWEEEKELYFKNQTERNRKIQEQKEAYFRKDYNAIIDYYEMVLSNSKYPDTFPQDWDLEFNTNNKILVVDYALPNPAQVSSLKEVKYIISNDEFKEVFISASAFNNMYDSLLYQITLRTIHELYEADAIKVIDSIVFNGWVNSRDKATGQESNTCILTVQASRSEFLSIDFKHVDPKACFKKLKGVGSSKLHSLSPVAPIMKIDREDKRFISAYDVAADLNESVNLASMDWQDFENLIRELFEKEFTQTGGEVRITQASRDGGVDAVAFDPDPIRGGKIVIQAKRYTNVVGVSAVRDLYGTVINEGATKGILVTTADYGPDAYDFAKGKPITLLNGGNLLHLLEKHGHKARIDIKEAKNIIRTK
jgi:restriction system protein